MVRVFIQNKKCGIEEFFKLVGTDSKVATVMACCKGRSLTLPELRDTLGDEVDDNALAKRLMEFTRAGVIDRVSFSGGGTAETHYRVTQKSVDMLPALNAMQRFYETCHTPEPGEEESGPYAWMEYVRQLLGSKWNARIIWLLFVLRRMRFGELKDSIEGVSFKMLTQQLKLLENAGVVRREEIDDVVLHTEYSLTRKGEDLYGVLLEISLWDGKHVRAKLNPDEKNDRIHFDLSL